MSNTILQSYTLPDGTVLNPNDMAQALLSTIAQAPQRQVLTPEPTQEAASPLVSYAPQEQQAVKGRSVAEHIKNGGSKDALTIAEVARQEVANLEANKKYDNLDQDHPIVNTAQLENTNPLISVPANLANMSLAVTATANNIYRNIKTIPDTVDAAMIESTVSDQVKEAYSTVMRFNADRTVLAREYAQVNDQLKENPNDKKLLTRKSEIESENKLLKVDDWVISLLNTRNPKTGNTFREDLDNAQAIRKSVLEQRGYEADGKTPNALNTKEWYNQRNMQNLQENVAGDTSVINAKTDTAKLGNAFMSAFDNATNNLTTVPTTIAESIPYFVAPATGAVSALTDQAAKSTAQFTAREGRLPTGQEKADMALYDLAYAGLNFVGDKLVTTPLGVATKPTEAAAKTPLQMATSVLGSTGRIAAPTVTETGAEGLQSAIEGGLGSLSNFDNPTDVGIGAALGGLSGGVVGTPGAIANEFSSKSTVNPVAPTDTTTDVADLTNPQSNSYNPSEAVKRYVFAYSQAETQEDKDRVFNDARQTVNDAQGLIDAQTTAYAQYEKVVNGAVTRNEAKLEEILANPELSDESKELYTDLITKANAAMTASYNIVKEATPEVYLASLDKAKATQEELQSQFGRLNKLHNKANYSTYDATIELEPLPENVSKINSVVNDLTNGLTDDQRNNLRKFSEAIVALNTSKDLDLVTGDITTGSKSETKNFRGLKEYVKEWNIAKGLGNTNVLNRLYTQLTAFQDSHIKKLKAAKEAFSKVPTGLAIPVWKSGNEWVLAEVGDYQTSADVDGLVENGGMLIHKGSGNLIQRIGTEVESIGKTVDYFNSVKPEEVTVTEDFQSALDDYNNLDRIIRNQYQADKAKKEAERAAKAAEPKAEDKEPTTEISSNAKGLAAALTNPTELAKSKGNITESYPIEYGGKTYKDAEAVFQAIKDPTESRTKPAREVSNNYSLMVAILKAKLKQYPALVAGITKQGGSKWILAATHQPTSKNTVWETGGENWFILALNEAYLSQVEPSKKETKAEPKAEDIELAPTQDSKPEKQPQQSSKPTEPKVQPVNQGVKPKDSLPKAIKDKETAKIKAADSFIGKGSPNSSTAYYEDQYGELANKGSYKEGEKVFVSVNGKRQDAVKLDAIIPELDKAIKAQAVFITDNVITSFNTGEADLANYLISKGYKKTSMGNYAEWSFNADPSTGTVEIPIEEDVNDQDVGTANLNTDPETIATDSESTTTVESTSESVDPVIEDVVDGLTAMQGDKEFERALSEEDNRTESTGYQKANLLVASFKQVKSTFLAANKDFMSWLKEDLLTNAASILGALTPKQEDALVAFSKFNDLHSKKIESFIRNKGADSKFKYQDWIQYLINPDGTIDENIKTAITASMFSWVAENGGKRYRNMEQVAALFGFKETAIVPLEVFKEFTDAGQFTNQIIQSLGERAYKSLGFKLDKGLSSTRKDKLQSALGTIAYVLMLDGNLLEETSYGLDEFREFANMISDASEQEADKDTSIANNSAYRVYLARPVWENNEPNKFVKRVMDVTRGTQGLMNSLFGTENELRYPSFEPIKGLSQKTISSTGTEIPLDLAQKVKRMQAKPYSVNPNMVNFYQTMSALNQEALLRLLGYVPIEELADKHISTRLEQQAINEGIVRSINNNLDFLGSIEGDTYPDMYMPMKVWEVNRIGIDATVLNEQADKISRSMIGLKDHTVTIDIDSPFNADGTITPFGYYLLALGANMEEVPLTINTTPDKTTAGLYIPSFLEYINTSPVVAKGVEAMREMRNGGLADLNAIQEAVSEFGMAGLSVMALDSLVDYFDAKASGTQLTTSLAFESDGVTNGLIISAVAYGAYSTNLLEAGGLYGFDTDTVTNVGYRAKGGKDVYQQIGEAQKEIWSDLISEIAADKDNYLSKVVEQFASIANYFDKNFGSRKGAKVATTPFVYGSSFGSINRAISYNLINMIYKAVEDNINNPEGMKTIEDNLNILVDLVNTANRTRLGKFNLVNATKEELLDSEFPKDFVKGVAKLDGKLRGKATMFALQRVAGDLIDSRKQVTTLSNVGAELFGALYEAMYKVVEAENELNIPTRYMKQDGEMSYVRLEPMSDAMEAEVVSRLLPYDSTIRSANSVFNGKNATEASHRTYNFKRDKYYEYSSNHVFAKAPLLGTRKTYNTPVTKRVIEPKGVGISAILIQSMDAFVTATTSSSVAATNHHDANGSSVTEVVKMATTQNQAFTTVQSRYHLASESLNAFFAPLKGMFESNLFTVEEQEKVLFNTLYIDTKNKKGLFASLDLETYETHDALNIIVNNAFNDDIAKLRNLTKVKHVNQYGTEGGQYALTNADRSLLLKEIDKLEIKRQEYLDLVSRLFPKEAKGELKTKPKNNPVKQDTSTKPTEEIKVNEPVVQTVPTKPVILQNSFTKKLTDALGSFITLGDLLPELTKQVKATNGDSLQLSLVALINKGLGKDIKVYVVDANTASNDLNVDISQLQNGKYSGLHTYNSNGEDVIVVRADKANSGLILHEYVHALTVLATKSKEPKAKELIKELTQTMEATKDFYQKNQNTFNDKQKAIIEYALTNLDEFLAVGFSSKIFQEVLMQVPVTKVTNRIFEAKSLFQMFIDSVVKYLGIKPSDNTALASLIYNGTSLMVVNQNITANLRQQDILFSAVDEVDSYSVSDIFDSLNTTSDNDFNNHLKDVFNSAVQGAYSLIQGYDTNQYTPFQVWESLVTEGKAPYSSALGRVGFNLTAQERFVIESLEVSIKAALDNGFNTPVYREMLKVYEDARKTLKPEDFHKGDWSTATEDDKSLANAKYNALFEGNAANGRSDYMSKFIAASLGSKEVRELMYTVVSTRERSTTKKSYYEKLTSFINSIMNWVNGYLTRTLRTDTASGKLPILAKQLIEIKNQRKDGLINQVLDRISSAQAVSNAYGQLFGKKGADLLNGMAKSKRGSVRGSTKVVQSILRGNFMEDMRVMQDWRDFWHSGKPYGMAAELLSEFAEPSTMREAVYDLIRKHNVLQQHRKRLIDVTKSDLLSLFDNKLTKEERNAISAGMLRTNMQVMLKHIGIKGIAEAFKSNAVVDKAIAELTKELDQYEDAAVYKVRAKDLAMYQVKGEGRTGLAKNSDAIARNVGLENYYDVAAKDVVNLIDQYVALHTIKYMDQSQRQLIVKLLESNQSAMSTVLQYHGSMIKESKDTLFQSSTTNMIDGYLPEITNPHKEISIATSKEEEADLIRLGFKKVADLKMDKNDPFTGDVRAMYVTDVSVRQRFVTAAVSITNTARKGTSIFKGNKDDLTPKGLAVAHQLAASRMRKGLAAKAAKADSYDPRSGTSSVIPVYRNDGSIMDYRYEMSHAVRDSSVLERNNDFATLLGTYKGGIFDKSHTPTHNKAVFDMIHKDWAAYGDRQRHKFTEVSVNSDDPRIAELYKLLPDKTKAYVNSLYGETPLMVRTDLLRPVFGFQKLTIGNIFDKEPDLRGTVENFTVQMANVLLRNNPKAKVMKAEQAIQDIMAVVKNVIVIRNISTLLGNQTANMSILMARGINPKSIVEDSIEALRAGTQYRKDMSRKVSLEQNLLAGVGNPTAIRNELNRVNDSLNRNPLKEFIAAGMLPTIVEDLDNGQDEYAYTTKFADAIDQKTAFIPKGVKTAAKWAVVAQGTPAYEFLSNATQFSDFMAKYVAYKQVTLREGGTHEEGIRLADKLFIAYDVPTSPQLQYLNDMGLVMFTKYYIRIQRAMFYLLKNYPTTSLAQTLLAASGNYAGALDPSMLGGIGNPFTTSILGVPSAATEPFPIKMLLGF